MHARQVRPRGVLAAAASSLAGGRAGGRAAAAPAMRRARFSVLALHLAACAAKSKKHGPPVEWAPDPIAIATWTNKGFGDEEIEDDANVLEPEDFLWQKLDVSERRARPDPA